MSDLKHHVLCNYPNGALVKDGVCSQCESLRWQDNHWDNGFQAGARAMQEAAVAKIRSAKEQGQSEINDKLYLPGSMNELAIQATLIVIEECETAIRAIDPAGLKEKKG
jgi:hypothetical protein